MKALVLDLLRPPLDARLCPEDEKRVLPVELQMVGWTYESLLPVRRFAAAELRRRGGKVGLYRDYIEDAKEYAFRRTGGVGVSKVGGKSRTTEGLDASHGFHELSSTRRH